MRYEDCLTVREAQARYFALGKTPPDGGYNDRWVKLKVGFLTIYLPNISARAEVLPYHDTHHVLTEYDASWTGEAQVAAWEMATGCGRYWEAWLVNLHAVAIGIFVGPSATLRAFARGRRNRNLYGRRFDSLRDLTLGELRSQLNLNAGEEPPTRGDCLAFFIWSLAALGMAAVTLGLVAGVVAALVLVARRLLP